MLLASIASMAGAVSSTSLQPPLHLKQVLTVLPNLSPTQQACAQRWIDEATILQDHTFTLITLVDRMWGVTRRDAMYAWLRIYGPFTLQWIQHLIPSLTPSQTSLVMWVVEHNRLVMEGPRKAAGSVSHQMPHRLVTLDLLIAGLIGLPSSQRTSIIRRVQPYCELWDPYGPYPFITEERLRVATSQTMKGRRWRLLRLNDHSRPVTPSQLSGVFPFLAPDVLERVQCSSRSRWISRRGWSRPSMEDVVRFLERHHCITEMESSYARKLLGMSI